MFNKQQRIALIGVFSIVAIIVVIFFTDWMKTDQSAKDSGEQIPVTENPVEPVSDFYATWVDARLATDTTPYLAGLATSEILSQKAQEYLTSAQGEFESSLTDPVLCGAEPFKSKRTKIVFQRDFSAEVLVYDRTESLQAVSSVKLVGENGAWKIDGFNCNLGETGPEIGEFSFDKTGFLLKDSVQPPLDSNYWYLVYEENGLMGFTAKLNFDDTSMCTLGGNPESTCDLSSLMEAMPVHIKGQMSEAGVEVKHVLDTQ